MTTLLTAEQCGLTIRRLAHQLLEENSGQEGLVLIGLQPRGIYISDRLAEACRSLTSSPIDYGKLDITFYRDDFRKEFHNANNTDIPFSIENRKLVLIDDVLFTGRTVRAALEALQDFGRPSQVKLCVLVNRRFKRELPIQPDYCGLSIDTRETEKVKVNALTGEVCIY